MHHPSTRHPSFTLFLSAIWVVILLLLAPAVAFAGYLAENPDQVFAGVYDRLGVSIPRAAARDPVVWNYLSELKRAVRPDQHQQPRHRA